MTKTSNASPASDARKGSAFRRKTFVKHHNAPGPFFIERQGKKVLLRDAFEDQFRNVPESETDVIPGIAHKNTSPGTFPSTSATRETASASAARKESMMNSSVCSLIVRFSKAFRVTSDIASTSEASSLRMITFMVNTPLRRRFNTTAGGILVQTGFFFKSSFPGSRFRVHFPQMAGIIFKRREALRVHGVRASWGCLYPVLGRSSVPYGSFTAGTHKSVLST